MQHPSNIRIEDYNYDLPLDKIAVEPLQERDQSKLLLYKKQSIQEDVYRNISQHLPENSLLIFNNTKVIYARLLFKKTSGSTIEIFCLEPTNAAFGYDETLKQTVSVKWNCLVGGASKWKEPTLYQTLTYGDLTIELQAKQIQKHSTYFEIEFSWNNGISFSEILTLAGNIPLPPYIKRKAEEKDKERYQTSFAKTEGSVAAPTAGLHFTDEIFENLKLKNIDTDFLTLHVGAGTFKPVSADTLEDHEMHGEWINVNTALIKKLNANEFITAVGTTSLRTLETLYWLGVKVHKKMKNPLSLSQWEVYDELSNTQLTKKEALKSLIAYLESNNLKSLYTQTHILIAPGYQFKIAKALVTNFHQPQSTLLLLVAAAIGDNWKKIYNYALNNNFRFLSFGDGCLIYFD